MTVAVCEPVQALSGCLDSLRVALLSLGDKEVVQALRDVETLSRRTHSMMLEVVAEIEARGIATQEGFGSTARLLGGTLRLSARRPGPGQSTPRRWVLAGV